MIAGIQRYCEIFGAGACYLFSIMKAGEYASGKDIPDPLAYAVYMIARGWMDPDCTVLHPELIMQDLCGGEWSVLKAGTGNDSSGRPYDLSLGYELMPGEHDIHRAEWTTQERPGLVTNYGHFFYSGPYPMFDPMNNGIAQTKTIVSRRILRKAA